MAMTYQNFASLGVNLNRQKYGPLDISNVFTSTADLKYYLSKGTFTEGVSEYWYKNANEKVVPYPYEGQVLATVIDGAVSVYALSLDAEGNFQTQEIGAKIETDDKTIKLVDGKLELVGLPEVTSGKTFVPSLVNGVLTWTEPDTSTAEGQQQAIDGLATRLSAVETTVNGKPADEESGTEAVVGLVDRVAALEGVDNATQAELEAYKEVVSGAIADALQAAKDYADENDANTVYDDTALAGRVKAIEDDYLKTADKYDDTALAARVKALEDEERYDDTELAGRVTTAEGKINELDAAVKAIDYVDGTELATALEPYAKTADVNTELAKKADKTALDALEDRVDAFLTGTGATDALDSLQELIEYINTHDDADINSILTSIQAIEGKLAGVESTVAAHVAAAIEALKIGDYAKATDLTALAGRVEALEAKPFDTYATKTEVSNVDAKFDNYTTTSVLTDLLADKADADNVVDNETFTQFKTDNTTAIGTAKSEAIAAAAKAVEDAGFAVASEVEATYATKSEVTEAVEGIENDLLAYAKTADVNAALAKKIESGSITHSSETAAEGVTVDGTKLNIVVDAYTKSETRDYVAEVIRDMTGGESAADVLRDLNAHITTYTEKVGQIDAKDAAQDTAIAAAQSQADKGVADAAKVAGDLVTANLTIAENAREIGVAKGSIETVNTTLSEKIAALEGKDTTIEGNITALQTTVGGHTTTITEQGITIVALQNKDTELATLIQGNTDKFAGYYTKGEVDTKVQDVANAVGKIDLAPFAKTDDVAKTYATITALEGVSSELVAEITRAKAAEEKIANDLAFLIENDTEAFDSVKEIIEHVQSNGTAVAGIITRLDGHDTAVQKNADDIAAINDAIAAIVQPKASAEVTVAEDGTLGLGTVSTDKLVNGTKTLVIDGGSATE